MPLTAVDLRSDTVTRPSEAMRRAMASAEVGDDVFGEDPTVNRLQEVAADLFGREAALFVPSGTMGNLVSILAQTRPGQEVICEGQGHIYNYEMASMASVAGVLPRVVETGDGVLEWESVRKAIRPREYYRAQTAMVSLENTHNMAGGTVYPIRVTDEICRRAHEAGLVVHLDGARVFNAAVAQGESVRRLTRDCDSVQFCLSKGLGAPVGSMVVGSRGFIERCRVYRKMLGGGMRQAGVLAAAGLVALETGPGRLHEDHANAKSLATRLAGMRGIAIDPDRVQTNIVIFGLEAQSSAGFLAALAGRGVLAVAVDETHVRMVTHRDVSASDVERAADILEAVVAEQTQEAKS
jgi:threonine aldolase